MQNPVKADIPLQSPDTLFGLDPVWLAASLFLFTYLIIVSERSNRAVVALLGACLMVMSGVLTQDEAISGVDFSTLGLLTGMMVIVAITRKCGVFQFVAIWCAKKVKGKPWGLMMMLALVTAIFSAVLDNVTTVMLIVPVTLLITEELKLPAFPYLFTEIFASNLGGTATLIGDPPNIMIGSAVNLTFNDFLLNLAPIALIAMVVFLCVIYLIWGRKMTTTNSARRRVMQMREREAITDLRLLKQSLSVLCIVLIGFVLAHPLRLEPATIATFGAALLLLLSNLKQKPAAESRRVQSTFGEVEWITIFFFIGLFVMVSGLERVGLLDTLADLVMGWTRGDLETTAYTVLWVSAVFSAIVDNIPFVATMIPTISSMAATFGGEDQLLPLWWSLALGACLGGNGSLIGASANVIVAGYAERAGKRIHFMKFLGLAFPLMLVTVGLAHGYIYLRYFYS